MQYRYHKSAINGLFYDQKNRMAPIVVLRLNEDVLCPLSSSLEDPLSPLLLGERREEGRGGDGGRGERREWVGEERR